MTEHFKIHIISRSEIKTAINEGKFRHIVFEDIDNDKLILEYIIFKNYHTELWESCLKDDYTNIVHPGEIKQIRITDYLLENIKSSLPMSLRPGMEVKIVVWYWSEWSGLTEDTRLLRSLEDQKWRFRSFPY